MTQPVPSEPSVRPPIRTCVGCRTRDERRNLLRIVSVQPASDEAGTPRYLPDTAGTMPALEKKNGLARAFKRAVPAAALKACCEQIRAVLTARESSPEAAPGTV